MNIIKQLKSIFSKIVIIFLIIISPPFLLVFSSTYDKDPEFIFEQFLEEAEIAQKQAASVGSEWRDVDKFIKQSKVKAKNGDYISAIKLVKTAKKQSQLGYQQAISQRNKQLPSYLSRYN